MYRSQARMAVKARWLCGEIERKDWNLKRIQEEESKYVFSLSELVEELWGVVCDGSRGPLMSTKYRMTPPLWMVPYSARDMLWEEVSQVVMETLVEGFSRCVPIQSHGSNFNNFEPKC